MGFDISTLLYTLPAILLALTFHEFSHGLVATMLGDDTPRLQGRLTLNPLKHLDLIGTLMMIIAHFGWAKPVMVNPLRFKGNRKVGMLLVAIAGPLANVLLALIAGIFIYLIESGILPPNQVFDQFFYYLMIMNISLAAFNIIPLPPLDGSKVLAAILPNKYANWIYTAGNYSMIILMILIITGLLNTIIDPIFQGLYSFVVGFVNLIAMI